ncbi:MAG TPA: hypothetical protein VK625_09640 [Flavitalea sp.]|nr:hypothetical protein [Flavitalea sp.]
MTRTELAEQIRTRCSFLEKEGFIFHHQPQRIWYEKNEATRGFEISFDYLIYDFLDVYGLSAGMRFNEIEKAVLRNQDDAIGDSNTIHLYLNTDELNHAINKEILPTKDHYHFEISGEEGAEAYAALITAFYAEQVVPFFETYDTITAINHWVAAHPVDKHRELISSEDNAMVLRRIMIMYYAGDHGYEELLYNYKAHLESKKDETPFGKMYLNLLEMEKYIYIIKSTK